MMTIASYTCAAICPVRPQAHGELPERRYTSGLIRVRIDRMSRLKGTLTMRAFLQVYLLITILDLGSIGRAQSVEDTCLRSWDDEVVIRACSTFIDDRSRSPADLAKALNKRALAFGGKASLTSMGYEEKQKLRAAQIA